MEQGFQGKEGQQMPFMPDEFVTTISERYIELFEIVTGKKFERDESDNIHARIQKNVNAYLGFD
jgi:phosphoribosylaminoimidazole-succinocarboxamide synthase